MVLKSWQICNTDPLLLVQHPEHDSSLGLYMPRLGIPKELHSLLGGCGVAASQ